MYTITNLIATEVNIIFFNFTKRNKETKIPTLLYIIFQFSTIIQTNSYQKDRYCYHYRVLTFQCEVKTSQSITRQGISSTL